MRRIGKMTLNRNPENFFAETEQVAFHPGHIVPGIDFSNDPLLQGRLFSYLDTQISRLGGANFHELPINRSICPFHNNQRDGMHRQTINKGRVSYEPNTLAKGYPKEDKQHGFSSFAEKIDGTKLRMRSPTFANHYSQATLFWNSQSLTEKKHIIQALQFELGKVETKSIRENMVKHLVKIDFDLASEVAAALGIQIKNMPDNAELTVKKSPALSMENTIKDSIKTRKVGILVTHGADIAAIKQIKSQLESDGAMVEIIGLQLGVLKSAGDEIAIDHSIQTMPSVIFDGAILCGDKNYLASLLQHGKVVTFLQEIYKHYKTLAIFSPHYELLHSILHVDQFWDQPGVICSVDNVNKSLASFTGLLTQHRHWLRYQLAE